MLTLLEDHTGENLGDLGDGNDFLATTQKAIQKKESWLNVIKVKTTCST